MRKISILIVLALVAAAPVAFAQTQQTTPQQTDPQQQTQPPYNQPTQQTQPQTQTQPPYNQPTQQTQPPYDPSQQTQPQVQPRTQQQADQQQQEVVNTNNPGEIPAGTDLFIRADENITATNADPGRTYQGTVTRQVVSSDGRVLIPKGTPVQLAVMDNSGTTGNKNLQLGVKSMTINGNTYPVTGAEASTTAGTTGSKNQGIGANKRTATHVGGGAVLGTVLGAVIGGGKGAAIGAVTGAAAGGAVQVLTKGNKINVPAETEMQYHLDQPIRLQGYGGSNY
jgi:outer membrane biosynthesis protein TonB